MRQQQLQRVFDAPIIWNQRGGFGWTSLSLTRAHVQQKHIFFNADDHRGHTPAVALGLIHGDSPQCGHDNAKGWPDPVRTTPTAPTSQCCLAQITSEDQLRRTSL